MRAGVLTCYAGVLEGRIGTPRADSDSGWIWLGHRGFPADSTRGWTQLHIGQHAVPRVRWAPEQARGCSPRPGLERVRKRPLSLLAARAAVAR